MKRQLLTVHFLRNFLVAFSLLVGLATQAQSIEGDLENGESLFKTNCASCHQMGRKLIGPDLTGITERREMDWLIKWISNNQELRASGDATAQALFEEYNQSVMPSFPGLSDQDIKDILAYTQTGGQDEEKTADGEGGAAIAKKGDENNTITLVVLGGILFLLVTLLARVKNTLKQVQGKPTYSILEDANLITRTALKNPRILTVVVIVVAVVFFQQLYAGLMSVDVDEEYQPEQPIAFSHKLHAGENQINCNYCHYGARKGKKSNIPSADVCMNCHEYIQEGPKHGKEEIAKIYEAVGWNPDEGKYIEDYKKKPIKWVQIHKLPDLAYFNHAQHVTAGNVDCQTCHGPVQEMEEVYQYSPLTMGWCINCHRETKVQTKSNGYYEKMHAKLKEKYGEDAEITVEMIGGLECGKCHY